MRREFYSTNGINLLFSEILEREYLGKDAFGDDVWKEHKVDFRYGLTSMGDKEPLFTEFDNDNDKRAAIEFVEEYILPHIVKGGSLQPFSLLLVDNLQTYDSYYEEYNDDIYTSCWRCMALAVGGLADMTDDEKNDLAIELRSKIVSDKFDAYSKEMNAFYDLDTEVYRVRISTIDPSWDRTDYTVLYEHGLLEPYLDWMGRYERDQFYYFDSDIYNPFYEALMYRDEADFMAEFEDYPLVITRYNILKSLIEQAGYKF